MNKTIFIPLSALLLTLGGTNGAEVIFHETFAAGREKQNPPDSLAWIATVPDSVEVTEGRLKISGAEVSERAVIAVFPRVELAPGDSLTLSFEITPLEVVGVRNGALRVGLYVTENPPFAEGENPGALATGYLFAFNNRKAPEDDPSKDGLSVQVYNRLDVGDGITKADPPLTANQNHIVIGGSAGVRPGAFESGVSYTVELSIRRESEQSANLGLRISGGQFTDANDFEITTEGSDGRVFGAFDTVALILRAQPGDGTGGIPQAEFANIKLEVTRSGN